MSHRIDGKRLQSLDEKSTAAKIHRAAGHRIHPVGQNYFLIVGQTGILTSFDEIRHGLFSFEKFFQGLLIAGLGF